LVKATNWFSTETVKIPIEVEQITAENLNDYVIENDIKVMQIEEVKIMSSSL